MIVARSRSAVITVPFGNKVQVDLRRASGEGRNERETADARDRKDAPRRSSVEQGAKKVKGWTEREEVEEGI